MLVTLCCALLQIAVPPPRGYVNDFAGVLDAASVAHMEAVIAEVRDKTRGEIVMVTLSDIDDRSAADVALQIGRQWGVGAKGEAGDPTKNLGGSAMTVSGPTRSNGSALFCSVVKRNQLATSRDGRQLSQAFPLVPLRP